MRRWCRYQQLDGLVSRLRFGFLIRREKRVRGCGGESVVLGVGGGMRRGCMYWLKEWSVEGIGRGRRWRGVGGRGLEVGL